MTIVILCAMLLLVGLSHEAFHDPEHQNEPFKHLKKVLVCQDSDDQLTKLTRGPGHHIQIRWNLIDNNPRIKIEYNSVSTCKIKIDDERYPKKILAVVAPKPLEVSSRIPMYFFDTPFPKEQDVDEFPNGLFPLRNHWQSLKHAFSHYMEVHGWTRMVVVSDDSYYSQAFEVELIEHFKEKEFAFDVQRSVNTKRGRSFERALRYIKDNKAFIIVVNIDNANAQKLADAARSHGMTSSRYRWLVRDWPFENVNPLPFSFMISMTLSPYSAPNYKVGCEHDGPNLNSVSRGLALISEAVKNVRVKERIDYYYNATYEEMRKTDKCSRLKAFIRKFEDGKFTSIKSIVIHDSGDIETPYEKDTEAYNDLSEYCLQRSSSFKNPCNDTYIVIICVVWLMFFIMVMLIILFFNRCLVWT